MKTNEILSAIDTVCGECLITDGKICDSCHVREIVNRLHSDESHSDDATDDDSEFLADCISTLRDHYWNSVADLDAQLDIDEIWDSAQRIGRIIGVSMTRDSEWGYAVQCRGVAFEPDSVEGFSPCNIRDEDMGLWCDNDFAEVWASHLPEIITLCKTRDDSECDVYTDDYFDALAKLEAALMNFCDDFAIAVNRALRDACDYRYSDEACNEWIFYCGADWIASEYFLTAKSAVRLERMLTAFLAA